MPSLLGIVIAIALVAALSAAVIDAAVDQRDAIEAEWATAYLRDAVLAAVAAHPTACRGADEFGAYDAVDPWDWGDISAAGRILPGSRLEAILAGDDAADPMLRSATLHEQSGLVTVELVADQPEERELLARMAATGGWEFAKRLTANGLEITFPVAPVADSPHAAEGLYGHGARRLDAPSHVIGPPCSAHPEDDAVSRDYLLPEASGGEWSHPWK